MSELRDRLAGLSPEQRDLLARRLGERSAPGAERIAVVAAACRLPGGVRSPGDFWQLLLEARDGVTEVPRDRWDGEALFDADPSVPGRTNSRWGGFLERIDEFDSAFFGLSPREAAAMDPQQRLLLETAWEALESGGQPVERLASSATGVFVGAHNQSSDYWLLQLAQAGGLESHSSTGSAHSIMANRVSYLFDLRGPSMVVDTACSSSLVAVHLACQSLRTRECDMALAGGVNLMLLPSASLAFGKLEILSSAGQCRTFDASASGIARGEGCALVLLKRLEDAVRDSDPVLAVIRGSAVNQDGASNGLTAPNGPAQEAVIRRALQSAGVGPERIGFVETHGTGTPLGDPVEVEALSRTLGPRRTPGHRCYLGAVKTNLGHLEAAAGIAGLLKAVLCLQHRQVPANLHFSQLNPHIDLAGTPFVLPTALCEWERSAEPRAAGVSSFGFGGTNAHVVLEEYEPVARATPGEPRDRVLALSARSPAALVTLAGAHEARLRRLTDAQLGDYIHTAAARRSHAGYRVAVTGRTPVSLADALRSRLDAGLAATPGAEPRGTGVVFVFTGQGGQWPGMGRELLEREPVFREAVSAVAARFDQRAGWHLLDVLTGSAPESGLAATEVAQPAIFAMQVGLTALWRSWGVQPAAIIGHSVGEAAAAYAAGALTLDEAVQVVLHRGRLMQPTAGLGRMAQVELPVAELTDELAQFDGELSVAALNGPASTVVSGATAAVERLAAQLGARGTTVRMLPVDFAFHSAQMDACRPRLLEALASLRPRAATVPLISTVRGRWSEAGDYDAAYWGRNVRETVRFAPGIAELLNAGFRAFLEVGAHPALGGGILAAADEGVEVAVAASLRREQPARSTMLAALCRLYEAGAAADWRALSDADARVIEIPGHPWQRRRHWLAAPDAAALAYQVTGRRSLAAMAPSDCYEMRWESAATPKPSARGFAATAWLIVADAGGIGQAIAERIARDGGEYRLVPVPAGAALPGAMAAAVAEARTAFGAGWRGVVHCSACDAPSGDVMTQASLATTLSSGTANAVAWLRTMVQEAGQPVPRLWLVTRGGQHVPSDARPLSPAQATLWGLGRSVALEHPDAWGALVDVDPACDRDAVASAVCQELLATDGEDQVSYRGARRFVARLRTREEPLPGVLALDAGGSYLITGGYGDLGPRLAGWLVAHGARHIVLLGRSGLPARSTWDSLPPDDVHQDTIQAIRTLEADGAEVVLAVGDVADREALSRLLASLEGAGSPLRGVVHAAAAITPGLLADLSDAALRSALRAKVEGAWVLHELTATMPLDLFVLLSSVSGLFGAKKLAAYATANQFLDVLAWHRLQRGLPALCVDWGPWPARRASARNRGGDVALMGFGEVDDARAFALLTALQAARATPCAVARLDVALASAAYQVHGARAFLAGLSSPDESTVPEAEGPAAGVREELLALQGRERRDRMMSIVRGEAARVLALPADEVIDDEKGFFDLGFDSLLAVQLRRRLAALLGESLPASTTFNHSTVTALAGFLLQRLSGEPATADVAGDAARATPTTDALPGADDDVHALLQAELERLPSDLRGEVRTPVRPA